jgi:hypothetical protein
VPPEKAVASFRPSQGRLPEQCAEFRQRLMTGGSTWPGLARGALYASRPSRSAAPAAGGWAGHPENAHDAEEESPYHASPVYGSDPPNVGRLMMGWGQ